MVMYLCMKREPSRRLAWSADSKNKNPCTVYLQIKINYTTNDKRPVQLT